MTTNQVPSVPPIFSDGPFSPTFHAAAELIGKRWNGAIIYCLFNHLSRFSDLKEAIPGLSARVLSERLKQLEADGVLTRTVIPDTPVRVEYRLTEKGLALRKVMIALYQWGMAWHPVTEERDAEEKDAEERDAEAGA